MRSKIIKSYFEENREQEIFSEIAKDSRFQCGTGKSEERKKSKSKIFWKK